jgi:hypothetical protein
MFKVKKENQLPLKPPDTVRGKQILCYRHVAGPEEFRRRPG